MISTIDSYKKIRAFPSQKRLHKIWTVEIRGAQADLIPAIKKAQENGSVPQELGEFFTWLVDRWSQRKLYYRYTFYEDMKAAALLDMCSHTGRIDLNRCNGIAKYFMLVAEQSMRRLMLSEDKQARIKNREQYFQDLEVGFVSL